MNKNGYTLIEMLAAVTIFFIATTSLVTFFSGAVRVQRESLAFQELIDNTSYSLEYMSRALRMARKDDIESINCLIGDKVNYEFTRSGFGIKFRNYRDYCQEFYLENGRLKEWKDIEGVISENYLTSENIEVMNFTIGSSGWDQNDDKQPKLTMFVEIRGLLFDSTSTQPVIKIQTSISQRNPDVRY
ncbi:MAG: type II secretion system protein [Candidatus Nealsonbacteria bacterium]